MHPMRRVTKPEVVHEIKKLMPDPKLKKDHIKALNEGNQVYDFCNSPGFAILVRDVKDKINRLNTDWIRAKDKDQAEIIRVKGQTWHEIMEMLARYLQEKEVAQKALKNNRQRVKSDFSPQD